MSKKRRAEELLGQSFHENLTPAEREELQRLLEEVPALRAEAEELKPFLARITAGPVIYTGDLRPAVIAELSRRAPRRSVFASRWVLMAAAVVAVSGAVYWTTAHSPVAVAPGVPMAKNPAQVASSPVLAQADELIASRDYAQAYAVLAKAVETTPRAPGTAVAVQKMADLAFSELQWYPEAFAGYDRLRRDYVDQFRADKRNFTRLNLLDEARGPVGEYASLRALDAARRDGAFGAYETILAKYPATYVASQAAGELAMVVARADGQDAAGYDRVRALRAAQFQAKDPVAKQQLRIEVAHALRANPSTADEARRIYSEIAKGPYTALSELAKKSLTTLDAPDAAREPGL